MKPKLYLTIAGRIIALFVIIIMATYIPNFFPPSFFNDAADHWGVRHCWYAVMMFCLLMLSIVDTGMFIEKTIKSAYLDNKKVYLHDNLGIIHSNTFRTLKFLEANKAPKDIIAENEESLRRIMELID